MSLVWYIPSVLQTFLLLMLVRRRTYRTFPFFFAYTAFGVAAGVARFVTHGHTRPYFWAYWSTDAVYVILGTLTLFELFRRVLAHVLRVWWKALIFPSIIAVSIFLSVARMRAVPPELQGPNLWIITGEIAVRFMQVFTFAGLVTMVAVLGLRWQRHERGVVAGFGMYATVMLLVTTRASDLGLAFRHSFGIASVLSYCVALLIWIGTFRLPETKETIAQEDSSKSESDPPQVARLLADSSTPAPKRWFGMLARRRSGTLDGLPPCQKVRQ